MKNPTLKGLILNPIDINKAIALNNQDHLMEIPEIAEPSTPQKNSFQNIKKSANIRVIARFRPCNTIELVRHFY